MNYAREKQKYFIQKFIAQQVILVEVDIHDFSMLVE